ncbi:MAG: hypothetical protein E6501_22865, partial [Bradyrhizobium sp.]|nr:hypothetical protein [Bradyrhizobium sp.]
ALIAIACFASSVLKLYLGLLVISLLVSFAVVGFVAWLRVVNSTAKLMARITRARTESYFVTPELNRALRLSGCPRARLPHSSHDSRVMVGSDGARTPISRSFPSDEAGPFLAEKNSFVLSENAVL